MKLTYDKDVQVDGSVIGLTSDFELTPVLAKFLSLNHPLIRERTMSVEALIDDYRHSLRAESQSKADALSYQFLCSVYSSPKSMRQLTDILLEERNIKLREMFVEHENAIIAANERMTFVSRSEAATWWYLFWVCLISRIYIVFDWTNGVNFFVRTICGAEIMRQSRI